MKRLTWINMLQIVAPFVAVIFFAGIAQSEVKGNSKTNESQSILITNNTREIIEIKSDYKYIIRALESIEKKIDNPKQ